MTSIFNHQDFRFERLCREPSSLPGKKRYPAVTAIVNCAVTKRRQLNTGHGCYRTTAPPTYLQISKTGSTNCVSNWRRAAESRSPQDQDSISAVLVNPFEGRIRSANPCSRTSLPPAQPMPSCPRHSACDWCAARRWRVSAPLRWNCRR